MQQRRTALSTGDVEALGGSQAPEFGVEHGSYEGDRDPVLRYTRGIKVIPSVGVSVCVGLLAFLFGGDLRPLILVLTICAVGFLTAVYLGRWVLNKPLGSFEMRRVADPIRQGAEGFLRVQYGAIARLAVVVAFLIFSSYMLRPANVHTTPVERLGALTLGTLNTVAFALGATCSAAAGYVSMWVTAQTNIRVANAARNSFAEALQICFRGGAFSALLVLTMCLVGISSLYLVVYVLFVQGGAISVAEIPLLVVGYGFGASFVALFMQLGGGIYTKAADVGADLVGKVEAGIPEDDPRNPAVIADLVGDMVGDCVGSSADLFESIAAEIIGAMILGGVLASEADVDVHAPSFVFFPVVVHAFDVVVSTVGVFSVRDNGAEGTAVEAEGNPMGPLKGGYIVSCVLAAVGFLLSTWWLLDSPSAPWAWLHFFGCGVVGMLTAYAFVLSTQYYTDYAYPPVQDIAHSSVTGHATNIITGFSWGMKSTVWPTLVVSVAVIAAYWLGRTSGIGGGHNAGLLGTAVATMGMLSSAAFILAMNNFGPIADNAGGIVEMSRQPDSVRAVTDRLDAAGNVTKAITKGYSIGSAALACFLLFGAIMDEFSAMSGVPFAHVDIAVPEVLIGGLLGIMLIFLFTGLAVAAVGRTAGKVVQEVRRQFRERPGIMEWREPPDYRTCVSIVTQAALVEMRVPGLLAVGMPVGVGLVFRVVGAFTGRPLLGAEVLAAFLMFATVCGVLMALFLDNVGGAWDNAKKYVELGHCGGKGSEAHKAAVTGDTVGDPFKDTAGPALHVVIKLLSTTILVLGPLFISQ